MIVLETTKGTIKLSLNTEAAPQTAANFQQYVDDGFYNDTLFHRVIDGFMVQGGGLDQEMAPKQTRDPVQNEASNGLLNKRGTIAMARTSDPHSATAQFFINVVDNDFLNFSSETPSGWGYCVFGEVVEGMDVVDTIRTTATESKAGHQDVPIEPISIVKAYCE